MAGWSHSFNFGHLDLLCTSGKVIFPDNIHIRDLVWCDLLPQTQVVHWLVCFFSPAKSCDIISCTKKEFKHACFRQWSWVTDMKTWLWLSVNSVSSYRMLSNSRNLHVYHFSGIQLWVFKFNTHSWKTHWRQKHFHGKWFELLWLPTNMHRKKVQHISGVAHLRWLV